MLELLKEKQYPPDHFLPHYNYRRVIGAYVGENVVGGKIK